MAMLVPPDPTALELAEQRRQLPAGNFDLALRTTPVPRSVLSVHGWAVTANGPCASVELTVNGHPAGRARLGELRPDIVSLFGLPAAALCGFHHFIDLAALPELDEAAELGGLAIGLDGTRFALPPTLLRLEPSGLVPQPAEREDGDRASGRAHPPNGGAPGLPRRRPSLARDGRKLKLLVCTHELSLGGAQLFLSELLRRIAELAPVGGLVISPVEGPTRRLLEGLGFDVHVTSPFPVGSELAYEGRFEELLAWIAGREFDAALVNTMGAFPGADLAVRLGLPTLWAIHESLPLSEYWALSGDAIHPEVRDRAEAALRRTTAVFTCEATRECYEASLDGLRCLTLPYGIDIDALDEWRGRFDRAEARCEQGIGDEETVILCLGTIEPRKAQTQLVHAFAQIAGHHPRARLRLVGSRPDPHTEATRAAVSLHGLEDRVQIDPVVPDARPCYATADVLVSASDLESTPRSILEAMALGLPVLSTDVFGVPELITDGESGWLCPPRDVDALAAALDRVLTMNGTERSAVAARARTLVETQYRSEVCSRAWDQALRDLADAGRPTVSRPRADPAPAHMN